MVAKKRGLGRGLDALLGGGGRTPTSAVETEQPSTIEFDSITEPAASQQVSRNIGDLRDLPIDLC